jgi:hypothetical protein
LIPSSVSTFASLDENRHENVTPTKNTSDEIDARRRAVVRGSGSSVRGADHDFLGIGNRIGAWGASSSLSEGRK